ncbi:MAG TPA: PKD domain-containing protein, partial [Thermoplasmata archaeon]|nr:PKD domain-containing protein [Thermoplasmata archaeon]
MIPNGKFPAVFFLSLLVIAVFSAGCIFEEDNEEKSEPKTQPPEKDLSPLVAFEANKTQAEVDEEIGFNASYSKARAGNITYYKWDFGDGVKEEGENLSFVNHSYASAGTYNVTLTIFDSYNRTNTTWLFIGIFEHIHDEGRISATYPGPDTATHQHETVNDTLWVFYHIELDNPLEDPFTANCTLNLTIEGKEYWSREVDVQNNQPVTIEFNITVHQ